MNVEPSLVSVVRERLLATGSPPTPAAVAAALRTDGQVLGDAAVLGLVTALRAELVGFGPLDALVNEPDVTDVLVNAPDEVWVERGAGLERVAARFSDESAVRRLAQRLATSAGRRLDDASPFVDVGLPSGLRLHAVLPPVSPRGTLVSLRTLRRRAFTLAELTESGTLPLAGAGLLRELVEARLSFVVSGGTGSGKTTVLSSLLSVADPGERLLLVEDSPELMPDHPHVVRLVSRTANVEGAGGVNLRDLVRQALRMRPDRIIVGEVRGAEVFDLLLALNTGHDGSAATVHANSAADVPGRVSALAATGDLEPALVHALLLSGLDAVIQLRRGRSGRVLESVNVLTDGAGGAVAEVAYSVAEGRLVAGPGSERLARRIAGSGGRS